jgi:branched-chain amino acid transport system ATP-binding protein
MKALEVSGLSVGYGGVAAVRDLSFILPEGSILAIVGPNGAGKSSTLLGIAGVLRPLTGSIRAFGADVTGLAPHLVARRGMCLIPDDRGLFPDLTVAEHLRLAEGSPVRRRGGQRISRSTVLERFPQLGELLPRRCGLLSGGEQQMLSIAKTLLLSPRLLMVDELSLGLAPMVVSSLLPALRDIGRSTGMGIILVEQHFELALAISDDAMVLNHGRVVLTGTAPELLTDHSALETAYFGSEATDGPSRLSGTQ